MTHDEPMPSRPREPKPGRGPGVPQRHVAAAKSLEDVRNPKTTLPDGTVVRGHRPCDVCGADVRPHPEDALGDKGVTVCARGHVSVSAGADVEAFEL